MDHSSKVMTLDDFRKQRAEAHREWKGREAEVLAARAEVEWAVEQFRKAHLRAVDAHDDYRRSKDLFRVARDFKMTSLKDAEMVLKLRDGGAR